MTADTAILTVMHANSESGVLQPITDIARAAHCYGALVHTDAAQSIGKMPWMDTRWVSTCCLSLVTSSTLRRASGRLFVRRGTPLAPFVLGAGHERGIRPGTENVASIVGLGVASDIARRDMATWTARVRRLRDELWRLLREQVPALALNGHVQERLPNTLNVRFRVSRGPRCSRLHRRSPPRRGQLVMTGWQTNARTPRRSAERRAWGASSLQCWLHSRCSGRSMNAAYEITGSK